MWLSSSSTSIIEDRDLSAHLNILTIRGHLNGCRYVLHDRDAKFCAEFRETLAAAGVKGLRLPPRSPNLNAFAERWAGCDRLKRSASSI